MELIPSVITGAPPQYRIVREEHVFLADEASHTWPFIQLSIQKLVKQIQDRIAASGGIKIISSDNCAAQNKCGAMFMGVNELARELGVDVRWMHSEPGHGKGEADGVGGGVKHFLDKGLLLAEKAWSGRKAADARAYLEKGYSTTAWSSYSKGLPPPTVTVRRHK